MSKTSGDCRFAEPGRLRCESALEMRNFLELVGSTNLARVCVAAPSGSVGTVDHEVRHCINPVGYVYANGALALEKATGNPNGGAPSTDRGRKRIGRKCACNAAPGFGSQ